MTKRAIKDDIIGKRRKLMRARKEMRAVLGLKWRAMMWERWRILASSSGARCILGSRRGPASNIAP